MNCISTHSRRGITLVELTVTLGVTSSIMAMSAVLLGRLLERERLGRAELQSALAISQLAEQFRTDARGATACRVPPGEDADSVANWSFVRPKEELVRYEAQVRRLLRTELRDGQVVRRESYVVPASPAWVGGFGSWHAHGGNFAFDDGQVRFLTRETPLDVLQRLGNRSDGGLPVEF